MGLYEVIGMRLLVHGWWFCVQLTDVLYFIGFMSVQNQTNMKLKELKWFLVWRLLRWTHKPQASSAVVQFSHHGNCHYESVRRHSVLTPPPPSCTLLQPTVTEDFAHLPPEQRRKRLQQKLDEICKELQKEVDQRCVSIRQTCADPSVY